MSSTPNQIKKAARRAEFDLLTVADSDKLDGRERDALALVRHLCQEIATDER